MSPQTSRTTRSPSSAHIGDDFAALGGDVVRASCSSGWLAGESYELGTRDESRELIDLLATRPTREFKMAVRVLRTMFDEFDAIEVEKGHKKAAPDALTPGSWRRRGRRMISRSDRDYLRDRLVERG